ncbi:MAG TPA: DMT family transporter [Kiloniellales bacterium]
MSTLVSGNLVALLCMVLWATTFPVTDLLLRDWHPLLLVPARLVPGTLVILLITILAGQGKAIRRAPWGTLLLIGGVGMGLGTTLIVWAQDYSDPVTVSIIVTMTPLASALMGYVAGSERVTIALAFALVCAIAGGILISLKPEVAGLNLRGGEVLALISVILWAWFARAAVSRLGDLPDLARAAFSMTAASMAVLLITGAALVAGGVEVRYDLSLPSIGLVLWLGVVANGVTMVFWMTASRLLGVTVTSIHLNGVPFYVIVMALAAGGTIYASQLWGACLVAAGALLAQLPARKRGARLSRSRIDR